MFELRRSELVGSRADLAELCNLKNLKTAVEVGTDRGIFAAEFLSKWRGEMLYCVDSWSAYAEMPWQRDGDLAMAVAVLAPYARRVRLIQMRSSEVVQWFGVVAGFPSSIDFCYIDGSHELEHVRADLEAWWPVVRGGGILAGDDMDEEHSGVKQAVLEFARERELRVELTTDFNRPSSFYIEKELAPAPPRTEGS